MKIQLTISINFISSNDFEETGTMHTKSGNIDIMIGNETNEIIKEIFPSLLQKYQKGLKEKMKGSEFVFDSDYLLYYELHKINLNRSGSYIDSPQLLKNKKAKINTKNNDDKCFQYALTGAQIIKITKTIQKEYQKSSLLLTSIIGRNKLSTTPKRLEKV